MTLKMSEAIFREYDIRGIVGTELLVEEVYDLAQAIAWYFNKHADNPVRKIAVGMDGRIHSEAIKQELCRGLLDSGIEVVFIGLCPSPVLYFAIHTLAVDGGLMITASHNPGEYNGIKICLGTKALWGEHIRAIGRAYRDKKHASVANSLQKGSYVYYPMVPEYISWLADHFVSLREMPLSIVIDCGNGAAGAVLPDLIQRMQWGKVQLLYPEVDGTYPHHEADPVVEENMQDVAHVLKQSSIELGIGLDGDCDRMAAMTKGGELIAGDKMLAIFAQYVLEEKPGAAIVCDVKSSSGLLELLEHWKARIVISASGHAIIKQNMRQEDAALAGELSGHFFFKDRYFGYDDGIYAMMRLFQIIQESGKSLDQLLAIFPKKMSSREFRIGYNPEQRAQIIESVTKHFAQRDDTAMLLVDGIRVSMPYGWGLVRPANTQAVLCFRFESDTQHGLDRVKEDFIHALKSFFDDSQLRKQLS